MVLENHRRRHGLCKRKRHEGRHHTRAAQHRARMRDLGLGEDRRSFGRRAAKGAARGAAAGRRERSGSDPRACCRGLDQNRGQTRVRRRSSSRGAGHSASEGFRAARGQRAPGFGTAPRACPLRAGEALKGRRSSGGEDGSLPGHDPPHAPYHRSQHISATRILYFLLHGPVRDEKGRSLGIRPRRDDRDQTPIYFGAPRSGIRMSPSLPSRVSIPRRCSTEKPLSR